MATDQIAPSQDMLESVKFHTRDNMQRMEALFTFMLALRCLTCEALEQGYSNADLRSMRYYQQKINSLMGEARSTNHHVAALIHHL